MIDIPQIGDVVFREEGGEWEVFIDTDDCRSIRAATGTEAIRKGLMMETMPEEDEEQPEEVDLLSQLVATVSKALVADGTWDAFKVQVMNGGMKVAISVGWPDDEDEEEDE